MLENSGMDKGKILVIDDEEDILEFLDTLFTTKGFSVVTAANGEMGLNRAIEERPGVILLDIMMPEMDGHEVCRRLKSNAETSHIPVIMLTAMNRVRDIAQSMDEGADGFMAKPFDNRSLLQAVNTILTPGGRLPIFYMAQKTSPVTLRKAAEYESGHRIVCIVIVEDGPDSSLEDAGILQGAYLMSLAQESREDGRVDTHALLEVETPEAFGESLNRIHTKGGRVVSSRIYRDIIEVPFGILPRSESNE